MCSVGDNVVDRYVSSGVWYPGGGAVNVAVHAARAGAQASYVGLLGDDLAGRLVLGALEAEGVDTTHAQVLHRPNAATDVSITDSGDRRFDAHRTIDGVLELTADDEAMLSGCDWVYTNYSSGTESLVARMAACAPLAFDFSYKDEEYGAEFMSALTVAQFSRTGSTDEQCAALIERTHRAGVRYVVVTRGREGAALGVDGDVLWQAATPTEVVDTLGAGDAFLARFLCGAFGGEPVTAAAKAASQVASEVCRLSGAFGRAHRVAAHAGGDR
jgi:fructoselysine 6-kinase